MLRKEYSQALCYKITGNKVVALDHTHTQLFVYAAHGILAGSYHPYFVVVYLT